MKLKQITQAIVLGLAAAGAAQAQISGGTVKIGVLTDLSGVYSDVAGKGTVLATQMAIDDFIAREKPGFKIEIVSADHQNKGDIAANKAREWFERDGVDVASELVTTSVALAVQKIAKEKNKIALISGAASTRITNEDCNDVTVHWTYDTYAVANGTANGTWIVQTAASYGRGNDLGTNRYPVTLIFNETVDRPNISYLAQQKGWDGVSPLALVVTVNASGIIQNSDQTGSGTPQATLRLEGFPANSTFLVVNFGKIYGRGGRGGAGGPLSGSPSTPRTSGQAGGSAISIDQDLVLANFGTIAGGGGGGVGTSVGSGGGGAGLTPGLGGVVYSTQQGITGFTGSETLGGAGIGSTSLASGGGGQRGAAGASNLTAEPLLTGGAKGWAILRIGTPTVTTIAAGTQFGGTS